MHCEELVWNYKFLIFFTFDIMRSLFITVLSFFIFHLSFFSAKAQLGIQAHAGPDTAVCPNDSVQIGDNPISSFAMPPLTITWTPNTNISNNTIAQPYVWPAVTTKYYLHITDANGRSATDSVIVTAHSPSSVTMDPLPSLCWRDDPVVLNSGIPTGGWYRGVTINDSMTFDPFNAGVGQHEITYFYSDPYCSFSDSVKAYLNVFNYPTIAVSLSEDTITPDDTLRIAASGAFTYNWKPSTGPFSANTGDTILAWPDSTSTFRVVGTDTNGCADSTNFKIVVRDILSIVKYSNESDWKVFPNPVSDQLTIQSKQASSNLYRIRDLNGKVYAQGRLNKSPVNLNVTDWPAGLFVVQIINDKGELIQSLRVVKSD